MSIEKALERIAVALEKLASSQTPLVPVAPAPTAPCAVATSVPATSVAPTQEPAPAEPVTEGVMDVDQLQTALMVEYTRLGSNREPIDNVMRSDTFKVNSVYDLGAEQYAPLLATVKAIPTP